MLGYTGGPLGVFYLVVEMPHDHQRMFIVIIDKFDKDML